MNPEKIVELPLNEQKIIFKEALRLLYDKTKDPESHIQTIEFLNEFDNSPEELQKDLFKTMIDLLFHQLETTAVENKKLQAQSESALDLIMDNYDQCSICELYFSPECTIGCDSECDRRFCESCFHKFTSQYCLQYDQSDVCESLHICSSCVDKSNETLCETCLHPIFKPEF